VIDHPDAHELASADEPAREHQVIRAWRWIAGWVIVKHDDGCSSRGGRLAKHLARMDETRVGRSDREHLRADQALTRVKEQDAKLLDAMCAMRRQQEGRGVTRCEKLRTRGRGPEQGAPAELDAGEDATGERRADARDVGQIVSTHPGQAMHAAGGSEQPRGDLERIGLGGGVSHEHREQLIVAECRDTLSRELFAQPIRVRTLPHTPHLARSAFSLRYTGQRMSCRLTCVLAVAACLAACSEPPIKERQQAETALTAARAAEASTYAADELHAAESALVKYDEAVTQRDYRQALSAALDARDRAYEAAKTAAAQKAEARSQTDALALTLETLNKTANARLAGRPTGPAADRLRTAARAASSALQESRTLAAKGDYLAAVRVLTPAVDALRRELQAPHGR
jgi:hypothetical protein